MFRYTALLSVIVFAAIEAGPRATDKWQLNVLLGSDPMTLCNGGPDGDNLPCNSACGDTYPSAKPVAQGGILDTFWANDQQVCNQRQPPRCPLTYSMKKTATTCQKQNQK